MPLKPFHVLPCDPELQRTISDRVVEFLQTKTDLFEDLDQRSLWNKLDTRALVSAVPELVGYFRTFGLNLKEVAVTVCNSNKNAALHIDELPVVAKINFPILNTAGSQNLWYRVPKELMDTVTPIVNEFGSAYYDLSSVNLSKCQLIGSVEMLKPAVFNSQLPHMIDMSGCSEFPRLVLTCMFFNEPVDFLKE
jgi:hypothetical protein